MGRESQLEAGAAIGAGIGAGPRAALPPPGPQRALPGAREAPRAAVPAGPVAASPRVPGARGSRCAAAMSVPAAASNLPMRLLRRKIHKRNLKLRQRNLKLQAAQGAGTGGRRRGASPGLAPAEP